MSTSTLIIFALALVALGIIYYINTALKKLKEELQAPKEDTTLIEWLKEMKGSVDKNADVIASQLKDQRESLNVQLKNQQDSLQKAQKLMWDRLDNATKVISDVQKNLGGLQEFSKDMKDLSNVLKSPKLRGGLGEQFLYDVLANALPKDLYKTQYKFRTGDVCDAIIKTDKGLIPVDSKFPMENFKLMQTQDSPEEREKAKKTFIRDVKKRIDEVATKYILPAENTTDQAVMYIPSENVYYELLVNTAEIEDYAKAKNVVLASPNTFSYFLKILLVAYQQQELQQHAGVILKALGGLKVEAKKFDSDLGVLDGHLRRATNSMDTVKTNYQKIINKLENIQQVKPAEDSSKLGLEQKNLLE
ncbi:DNA recombination protein RmuC [Candidatus Nomurabacteria bacterium]|uniref:DNA recombination protein RmuC n=1 Tax=candidate division WWE3 bacterium TaxID=2053526 RepID=A0A955DZQ0_UNCKA|nr:DNA recombination protein RmuC [candidate division WWE3 bacterium]MCB9823486.1 DNA recombination protein RmuC [Candidatus Nomurabacteria bacterium]MCB9827768.1 DNA recombination protein RmuC [Candidatus Nomurabacteria bacterium]HXK52373.1 DNA recombination protein RmuC [bacterium]